jgi:phenylacetate-coenzyme A ligase PaaK-like adenylate-forming protein
LDGAAASLAPVLPNGEGSVPDLEAFLAEVSERLESSDRIDPVALADLFGESFRPDQWGHSLFRKLQMFLVRRTLDHARREVPHYRDEPAYAGPISDLGLDGISLDGLPVVRRSTIAAAPEAFLAADVTLRSVCHTSGSTGQPLELYKSYEEVAFIGAFFTRQLQPLLRARPKTLSLSLPTPHHGVPVPFPSPGIVFTGGVTDDTLIVDALRVLRAEYLVDGIPSRISRLSGMGFQLLFFTNYLLEQGVRPSDFGLGSVSIAGGFLPRYWRHFLERSWGCRIVDRYSLSECIGGATLCHACGVFRPDLQVVFEVLDPDTNEPLSSGVGKLVATNLYPFAQMMPLIRYETGDLVRVGWCACHGVRGFEFLGRLSNCISMNSGAGRRWLIFSAKLYDVLAELPDFNMYEWFSNVRAVKDRTVGSPPVVALSHEVDEQGRTRIRFEGELRYSPWTRPDRVAELERRITEALASCEGSAFAEALRDGSVVMEYQMLPPGGYDGNYIIKV